MLIHRGCYCLHSKPKGIYRFLGIIFLSRWLPIVNKNVALLYSNKNINVILNVFTLFQKVEVSNNESNKKLTRPVCRK